MRIPIELIIEEERRRRAHIERTLPLQIREPFPFADEPDQDAEEASSEGPHRGVLIISMFDEDEPSV